MKLGIIGGSFDPIHLGHLIIGQSVLYKKALDKIIYIPTGQAPHKIYGVSGEERLEMTRLATMGNKFFKVSSLEVKSESISYTVDSLEEIKGRYSQAELYFIIGSDNLFDLENWSRIEDFYKYSKVLVTNRRLNERSLDSLDHKIRELKERFRLDIEFIDSPIIEISSTMIRELVRSNKKIDYLTSKEVVKYIESRGLYK